MRNIITLFIALLTLLGTTQYRCFAQTELTGTYKGTMSENPDWKLEFKIGDVDSLVIKGAGTYPENQRFKFHGVIQNMNVDNDFSTVYKVLAQLLIFDEYAQSYQPTNDFIELSFEIEFVVETDSDGMPDVTDEIAAITGFGVWYEKEGMEPKNVEFEFKKQ